VRGQGLGGALRLEELAGEALRVFGDPAHLTTNINSAEDFGSVQ